MDVLGIRELIVFLYFKIIAHFPHETPPVCFLGLQYYVVETERGYVFWSKGQWSRLCVSLSRGSE